MKIYTLAPLALAISCSLGFLSGCSSSSSGNSSTDTSISGTIVAAPVNGAQVSVVDGNGNVVAGPVNTNSTGQYTLNVPNSSLNQDLIVKSTGGTFTDEATGNNGVAGEMFAYAPANSLDDGDNICATPGSTIIANLIMNHNKTMSQAQEAFSNAFGYTPDVSVTPVDATLTGVEASEAAKLAGFRAAAFSQLAMDLGLSQNDQFEMFAALAEDLSDDVLDGINSSSSVDIGTTGVTLSANIQNRFSGALVNFLTSGYNETDLNNAQIGNVPFSKVALTDSYQIEYIQTNMMGAMEGKSTFQIHVTDRNTGEDVTGLMPMLMPIMNMATMTHSTPMPATAVSEDANGLYTVNVYYLMPSQMMDGTSMGYWDLKFTIAGEVAHFYPVVKMAMGDTTRTRLKGQADEIKDMMGMNVSRDYFILKDSLTGSGPYTFTMFIAAQESMMSFPAVIDGNTLQSGMGGTPLAINSIGVNVSVNSASSVAANDNGDGTWDISLPLNNGEANQVEVELTINGERKTSDGTAAGLNSIFTITPGGM